MFRIVNASTQYSELDIGHGSDYECAACGYTWPDYGIEATPIQCPKCNTRLDVEIEGIGELKEEQLGKALGKYSWCSGCDSLTMNAPGRTYCNEPLSADKLPDRFFSCVECGHEKFWQWPYQCPRCDSDKHAILSIGEAHYNPGAAMEFGGMPMSWDEEWLCVVCGYEYGISNSNY